MGYILKYKLWESNIYGKTNPILEQETGFDVKARSFDTKEVKAAPGYNEVIIWWSTYRKRKLYSKSTKTKVEQSKTYWLGDVSSKQTGNKIAIRKIEHIATADGAQKILDKINKAYGPKSEWRWKSWIAANPDLETVEARIADGYYDAEKIADAASQISSALSALSKKGKRIGGIQTVGSGNYLIPDVKYVVYSVSSNGKTGDRYLSILPFASENYYNGKTAMSFKTGLIPFDKWYNQISKEGGVMELIDKINDTKHWDKKEAWTTMKPDNKIEILEGFSETAKKHAKNISDATWITVSPIKSKFTEEKDPTPWVVEEIKQGFPTGDKTAMNFMEDDSSIIRDEYKPEFINWVKEKTAEIAENEGKDVAIDVQLIASTSQVPSSSFDRTADDPTGNIALVNARMASMKQFVNETLASSHMPGEVSYVETPNPNQGPTWEDVKNDVTMGEKGARTQAYKDRFSKSRYSAFVIRIQYKTKSRDEIVTMKEVGEWKSSIGWRIKKKHSGGGRTKKYKNEPWKPYDGKTCPIFPSTKGKVKVNIGWL